MHARTRPHCHQAGGAVGCTRSYLVQRSRRLFVASPRKSKDAGKTWSPEGTVDDRYFYSEARSRLWLTSTVQSRAPSFVGCMFYRVHCVSHQRGPPVCNIYSQRGNHNKNEAAILISLTELIRFYSTQMVGIQEPAETLMSPVMTMYSGFIRPCPKRHRPPTR